jgi:hypothetical protein
MNHGDPLPDQECWFRPLTNEDHRTKDNTVHHQALKKRAFLPAVQKAWSHELSGRVVSRAGMAVDITNDAEARVTRARQGFVDRGQSVPSKLKFVGLACATAIELRSNHVGIAPIGIIYTPLPADSAHSDFVTYNTVTDADCDPARDWLIKKLRVVQPPNVSDLLRSCGKEE